MTKTERRLRTLEVQGFDRCTLHPYSGYVSIGCSQCAPDLINGVPCHETGCPNQRHECRGCNALVPMRQPYCEDCAGELFWRF